MPIQTLMSIHRFVVTGDNIYLYGIKMINMFRIEKMYYIAVRLISYLNCHILSFIVLLLVAIITDMEYKKYFTII